MKFSYTSRSTPYFFAKSIKYEYDARDHKQNSVSRANKHDIVYICNQKLTMYSFR